MNAYQSTPDFYRDYIQHFNKNHDPKNGQFSSGHGGSSVNSNVKKAKNRESAKSNFDSKEKVPLNERELKEWSKKTSWDDLPRVKIDNYGREFENTPKGKKLYKKFSDTYDDYFSLNLEEKVGEKKAGEIWDKVENDFLKERHKYAVNKFLKNDAKNYTLQQIAYDSYPMYGKPKSVSEQDIKDYLLNEQWKSYKV